MHAAVYVGSSPSRRLRAVGIGERPGDARSDAQVHVNSTQRATVLADCATFQLAPCCTVQRGDTVAPGWCEDDDQLHNVACRHTQAPVSPCQCFEDWDEDAAGQEQYAAMGSDTFINSSKCPLHGNNGSPG